MSAKHVVEVRVAELVMPKRCCACDAPTAQHASFQAGIRGGLLLRTFLGTVYTWVAFWICESCQRAYRRRVWLARGLSAGVGALIGLPFAIFPSQPDMRLVYLLLPTLGVLLLWWRSAPVAAQPVKLTHYSPTRGTVRIGFKDGAYAAEVAELSAARQSARLEQARERFSEYSDARTH